MCLNLKNRGEKSSTSYINMFRINSLFDCIGKMILALLVNGFRQRRLKNIKERFESIIYRIIILFGFETLQKISLSLKRVHTEVINSFIC